MKFTKFLPLAAVALAVPTMALAQEATPGFDEIGPYIMTTLLFCMAGFLVFFMAAGFAMLEGGLVRSKNVTMQMTKNISLYSVAAIMYWLIGFNLMYPGEFNGYVGSFFVPTVYWTRSVLRQLTLPSIMPLSVRTSSSSLYLLPQPRPSFQAHWLNASSCGRSSSSWLC